MSLRVIEVEDKSSTEQGVAIRSGPELCLDDQWWLPRGSITCADKQYLQASQRKILFKSTKKVIPVAVVKKNILAIQIPGDGMINPSPKSHKYSGIRG